MEHTVICPKCQYVNVPMYGRGLSVCGRCGHRLKSAESAPGKLAAALIALLLLSVAAAIGVFFSVRAEHQNGTVSGDSATPAPTAPPRAVVAPIITPVPVVPSKAEAPISETTASEMPEAPVAMPVPAPSKRTPRPGPKMPVPDKAAPMPPKSVGYLNLNSVPTSHVLMDGRPVGQTPVLHLEAAAGVHSVTFIHKELGRKTVSVSVSSGKTAVATVRFE